MNWSAWQSEQLKALEHFKSTNRKMFKNDFSTINNDIEELIKKSFENGKLDQERVILEAIRDGNFKSDNKQIFIIQAKIKESRKNSLLEYMKK